MAYGSLKGALDALIYYGCLCGLFFSYLIEGILVMSKFSWIFLLPFWNPLEILRTFFFARGIPITFGCILEFSFALLASWGLLGDI